ncbi:MAG: RNA polymerase sigma-70 factor [Bacteroidales bacterium]|nr:RNA polymerase sigma-70 factor [Bacteroidales bacterium]MDD2425286.1 RNA polymerase sigma-70 factor [Bacteroidales bacterium]MDD3989660.1 RNA polymerase sigma-70 factor [Bacteroidales bacterium]
MDELTLRAKIKARNNQAIEYLFDTYYERLFLFSEKFIYNSDTAHDMVQSVLIRLWENADKIEFKHSVKAYLFTSVKNECLQYLRSLKIRDNNNRKWASAYLESMNSDIIDDSMSELIDLIKEYVNELPLQCKTIFKYRLSNDLKYSEIAEKLNVSENVVKVQIFRANKKLREIFRRNNMNLVRALIYFIGI